MGDNNVLGKGFHAALARLKGEPVAILCARHWYRGVLVDVWEGWIRLGQVRIVGVSGAGSDTAPIEEDIQPSDFFLSLDAVETISQPAWAFHEIEQ